MRSMLRRKTTWNWWFNNCDSAIAHFISHLTQVWFIQREASRDRTEKFLLKLNLSRLHSFWLSHTQIALCVYRCCRGALGASCSAGAAHSASGVSVLSGCMWPSPPQQEHHFLCRGGASPAIGTITLHCSFIRLILIQVCSTDQEIPRYGWCCLPHPFFLTFLKWNKAK